MLYCCIDGTEKASNDREKSRKRDGRSGLASISLRQKTQERAKRTSESTVMEAAAVEIPRELDITRRQTSQHPAYVPANMSIPNEQTKNKKLTNKKIVKQGIKTNTFPLLSNALFPRSLFLSNALFPPLSPSPSKSPLTTSVIGIEPITH
jgi:hypothetical protein